MKSTGQLDPLGMSKRRVVLLNAVLILLITSSLSCIVFDKEYWPFSQYPMFSWVERKYSFSAVRLYGATQERPHNEIPLLTPDYIQPFDQTRLPVALERMESKHNTERRHKLLNKALLDVLERYETLRLAGRHDGPPLQGVRLYKERWQLDARAENVNQPDHRRLIVEVE